MTAKERARLLVPIKALELRVTLVGIMRDPKAKDSDRIRATEAIAKLDEIGGYANKQTVKLEGHVTLEQLVPKRPAAA